ncbi:MAG: tetratricopeptide repeat protein, partial [Candidatus Puniceispirillaceae bacterium]
QAGGNILRRADRCDKALVFFQQALDYGMENYRLYRNFGICYEQINNQTEAEKALLKAIELNPNDAIALNYLGYWWADENRHLEKAITFIQKAVQLQPYSGYYADSLGWVYYRQGAFDKAVLWLEKAIQLTPTDAIISEHLGDAYWQTGRFVEARFKWQHALDMGIEESRIEGLKAKLEKGL